MVTLPELDIFDEHAPEHDPFRCELPPDWAWPIVDMPVGVVAAGRWLVDVVDGEPVLLQPEGPPP
ncbi:MAG: hypothetical protein H6740_24630 [Alphaproteobacteria bacterium]|nr:hypothetical protein [Alphaproteobacteria bacterium]